MIDESLTGPAPPTRRPGYETGVAMPGGFPSVRVRTDRGLGVILRVRRDKNRPFLIQIDGSERPYWPLKSKIQPIGFSKSVGPTQPA